MPSKTTKQEEYALAIRHYANTLLDAEYDNIPKVEDLNLTFRFTQNDFMHLSVFA